MEIVKLSCLIHEPPTNIVGVSEAIEFDPLLGQNLRGRNKTNFNISMVVVGAMEPFLTTGS